MRNQLSLSLQAKLKEDLTEIRACLDDDTKESELSVAEAQVPFTPNDFSGQPILTGD